MIIKGIKLRELNKVGESSLGTSFDGVNEYVNFGQDASIDFNSTDAFTYSFWLSVVDWNIFTFILTKSNPYLPSNGMDIRSQSGRLKFYFKDSVSAIMYVESSGLVNNQIYHIAVTNDGTATIGGMKIYIDGVDDTTISTGTTVGSINNSAIDLVFGASNLGTVTMNGILDEIAVFNRELTPAEVTDIYGRGRVGVTYSDIPNLVSHWGMNTLNPVDETGTNNGTSVNMDASNLIRI